MEEAIRDSARSLENNLDTNCNMNARVRALEAHNEAQQLRQPPQVNTAAIDLFQDCDDVWNQPDPSPRQIQGHDEHPSINALERSRNSADDRQRSRRPAPSREPRGHTPGKPFQRSKRPTFLEGVRCEACGTDGHKAITCILAGRVATMLKYIKTQPDLCHQIQQKWVNREEMARNVKSVQAYMQDLELTAEQFCDALEVDLPDILGLEDS